MHGDLNMNDSAKPSSRPAPGLFGDGFDIGKMLLEGRAFFALIVIVIVFSFLSPYYFALAKFSDDGLACGHLRHPRDRHAAGDHQWRNRPVGRIDPRSFGRGRGLLPAGRDAQTVRRRAVSGGLGRRRAVLSAWRLHRSGQRRAHRAIQGARLRRHPRGDVRGARYLLC